MAERKALSKKIRFEVFKRDGFTCQYCGKKAPDVVLHVDHIKPVAEGGENDILNLITSCVDCNLGKGKRELSDDSLIQLQRNQIEEQQERLNQIDMMVTWKRGLLDVNDKQVEAFSSYFNRITGTNINENGKRKILELLKDFDLSLLFEALDAGYDQYCKTNNKENLEKLFSKLGGICKNLYLSKTDPYHDKAMHITNTARKNWRDFRKGDWKRIYGIVHYCLSDNIDKEVIFEIVYRSDDYSEFRKTLEEELFV